MRLPRRLVVAHAVLAALIVSLSNHAEAQVPLLTGFGGPVGYGSSCLGPNDDGSSMSIPLTGAFPSGLRFFGTTHTSMYVNTNGNITFSGGVSQFTASAFPLNRTPPLPMIAPYWADVDIRNVNGTCLGSAGGSGYAGACQNPTENGVWWYLEPNRIIVTWDRVGYYTCHNDHRMHFQLVLTGVASCAGGGTDFDVEFRFNRCEWTTGDASGGSGGFGGTPAQSGFDAGDGMNFVQIMGSRTPSINTIMCTQSNVGTAGLWRFQIRNGSVVCPGAGGACNTGMMGVCAEGQTQCVGAGTSCVQVNQPQPDICDGLDNNCDGMVDNGATCPAGLVCDRGNCVPMCVEGGCLAGQTCVLATGTCAETACLTVTCAANQRCVAGACVGACDGITCPAGQVCRVGGCVDPCIGLTCDAQSVCEGGLCVPRCPCRACSATQSCAADGHCVETPCVGVSCPAGSVCQAGACVDACATAVCPTGQICSAGNCIVDPNAQTDAGTTSDSSVALGDVVRPGGPDAGTSVDGSVTRSDGGEAGRSGGTNKAGCACRSAGTGRASAGAAALIAGLALALTGRRRRRTVDTRLPE